MADEAMAQGCAETGAMQTVVQQGGIVSNGWGNRNPGAFGTFGVQKYILLRVPRIFSKHRLIYK